MSDIPLSEFQYTSPDGNARSPSVLTQYRTLLVRYLKPQILPVIWMTVLLFSGILLKLANPQVIRYFIDTAQQGGSTQSLWTAALLFIVFAILQQALSLAAGYISYSVGWTATNLLRTDLLRHVLRLDMPFHKTHTPGELIDRLDGDVNQLGNFFSLFSISVLGNGLLILGILVLLFRENTTLGLGMLVYTGLVLVVLRWIQTLAVPRWAAERRVSTELYGYIEERISGAEEIRALGVEAHAMRRLFELMRAFTEKTRIASVISSLTYNLTNLVFILGYAVGLSVSVYLFTRGQASLGTAYLITYYIGMLSEPLQAIRSQSEDLQQATANIQRVHQLFSLRPHITNPTQPAQPLSQSPLSIAFEHVSFRYQDRPAIPQVEAEVDQDETEDAQRERENNTLDDISFSVQPGHVIGILGRTGSGKSTLTRLLFRLYDPHSGSVSLDGVDLRAVALADLRDRVGMVTQDVQLFHASVRDNLTFFNATIPDARLEEVLKALRLWDWVQSLPQGLASPLSGGQSLSAGEAQLLAFARVFLKDPGLVILDEASSRLDPSTEALMELAVDRLFSRRTGVVIAHRLKTVQRADDILILEDGRVVEYGARTALASDPNSRFYSLLRTGLEEALA